MSFDQLKNISFNLEQNINILEQELSDATKFVYQCGENVNSAGIGISEKLSEDWKRLCEELQQKIMQDEADYDVLHQEFNVIRNYVIEYEEKENEFENFLIQQNLLELDSNVEHEDVQQSLNGCGDLDKKEHFKSPPLPKPKTFLDNTFCIARSTFQESPELNKVNQSDFQNTMCDFQTCKEPVKQPIKALFVPRQFRKTQL